MPNRDDDSRSHLDDELGTGKRINFRDYPSTGLVVFAALVSSLGWLVYKWSAGKRADPSTTPDQSQQPRGTVSEAPASDNESTSAEAGTKKP